MKSTGLAESPLFLKPIVKKGKKADLSRHQKAMVSRNHDTTIAAIRKAISEVGKKASTYRLSSSEKKALVKIIYEFRIMKNIRITENEIVRIAIQYLIHEYQEKKSGSLLLRIKKPLF